MLVFIGRLIPSKQLDLLIEAAGLLKQQGKLVNVLLIGEGPDQEHLQEKTRQLDLDKHVVFYGACHDEQEVGPLLCMSDICVSPGPIGLTVMHSMVYGTPVISNDDPTYQMPEFEAIIPGATGDFFENKNAKSLASVILKVLDDIQTRGTKAVQHDCYDMISRYFTPASQTLIFNEAVKGTPADTLPLLDTAYLREQLAKWRCHY